MFGFIYNKIAGWLEPHLENHPKFVWDTVPQMGGKPPWLLITDHPTISYWSHTITSRAHLLITREELCKGWGCATQGARFYYAIKLRIQGASVDQRETYGDSLARVEKLFAEFKGCYDEIVIAMAILSNWEDIHHLPDEWAPTGPYDISDLRSAPNRLVDRPTSKAATPPIISPLFIHAARHAIQLVEEGSADEWWEIREAYATDKMTMKSEVYRATALVRMPTWGPVDDKEVAPRRRREQGVSPEAEESRLSRESVRCR
ncbi:hypothetical protein IAT38_006832 [Cryptococcus sp. DSM 104549]